jgi:hypothetical protein
MRPPACSAPGRPRIRATQDLQIISGLPPLVREGDQFRAQFTLRNTTKQAMKVEVTPRATLLELPAERRHPRRRSARSGLDVTAPAQLAFTRGRGPAVGDRGERHVSGARDALKAQPAHHPRRAADGAAGHAGADGRPVQPGRGAARRWSATNGTRPRRPQAGAATQAGRGPARRARLVRPLPLRLPGAEDQQVHRACATASCGRPWPRRSRPTWTADGLASYFPPREGDGATAAATSSRPTCWPPPMRPPA